MSSEVEIKLEIAPAQRARLRDSPWFGELAATARRENLVSTYFDTRERKLRRKGISLRVRRVGDKRVQTIKARGTAISREESEREIHGDTPDLELAVDTALGPLVSKKLERSLEPVFEVDVHRTSFPLRTTSGEIEVAIDEGEIRGAGGVAPISEIELELKEGEPRALVDAARRLASEAPVSYGIRSKADRGYALLEHHGAEPVFAEDIELDETVTVQDAFREIGLSCLRHAALNEAAVRAADPEGVHQMRVGLRRLRAAVSLFKEMLDDDETETVKTRLRWLTDQLGPARDYDVFVTETVEPMKQSDPHESELSRLEAVLDEKREEKFSDTASAVASDRAHEVVLEAALWLIDGHWASAPGEPARELREGRMKPRASDILTRRTRKIVKRLKRLEELDPRQRHELRIAVKKLRYGTQFFASLFPGTKSARKKLVKELKQLQDALGALNDIRVHDGLSSQVARDVRESTKGEAAGDASFAAGLVTGQEELKQRTLVSEATKCGGKLARAPRFWE